MRGFGVDRDHDFKPVSADNFREIQQRIEDELYDYPTEPLHTFFPISYHMTSIYDHSMHEAFSRIVQRMMSQAHVAALENLMNVLTQVSLGILIARFIRLTNT